MLNSCEVVNCGFLRISFLIYIHQSGGELYCRRYRGVRVLCVNVEGLHFKSVCTTIVHTNRPRSESEASSFLPREEIGLAEAFAGQLNVTHGASKQPAIHSPKDASLL